MKISDIILENDLELTVDQIAQTQSQHGAPISNSVISRAKRIVSNKGISALDAIGMAQDIERRKQQDTNGRGNTKSDKTLTRAPMTRAEPTDKTTDKTTDRVSKTGKNWGNQYYSDPSKTKRSTSGKYRDMKTTVSKKLGDILQKDAVDVGKDVGNDFTDMLDKFMKSGIKRK